MKPTAGTCSRHPVDSKPVTVETLMRGRGRSHGPVKRHLPNDQRRQEPARTSRPRGFGLFASNVGAEFSRSSRDITAYQTIR
jgi:hypothetical protein